MNDAIIEVTNVSKSFGGVIANRNVSLSVPRGRITGLIGPNGGALASAEVPEHPGTGSALLGFVQWVAAGIIAPIAGLGGEHTAVPMALLIIATIAASMIGLLVLARPTRQPIPSPPHRKVRR